VTLTGDAAGVDLTISSDGTLDLDSNSLTLADGNVTLKDGTIDLNGETLNVTATTGGGTLNLGGFTLTLPKTGTVPVGTGTDGRVAEWDGDANTLGASNLIGAGAGVLTLSAGGSYTLTVPKTGTATVGTGTDGRIAEWDGDANTLGASSLIKTGAGVVTLSGASTATLTLPTSTGTLALTSDISGGAILLEITPMPKYNWETVASGEQLDFTSTQSDNDFTFATWADRQQVWYWPGTNVTGTGFTASFVVLTYSTGSNVKFLCTDVTNGNQIYDTGTGVEGSPTTLDFSTTYAQLDDMYQYTLSCTWANFSAAGSWWALKAGGSTTPIIARWYLLLTPS